MSERQGEREKNDKVSEICARDETYVIFFCFRSPFGRGRRCIKKTVPFPCPQVFIFVHCRLVSQCNAPPITSHSFAPTPHPSRPSAHAPNTLWRQQLLRVGGGGSDSAAYRVLPIPPPPLPPSPPPHVFTGFLLLASSLQLAITAQND